MPKFTLEIDYGNAAMLDTAQLQDALERVAKRIGWQDVCPIEDMPADRILDENGNTVGTYGIVSRPGCTGATHANGTIAHDGPTCPIHEEAI
jgi:hypothetical protein